MTLHANINKLVAFGGQFELSIWMDNETQTVRALLSPFKNDQELKHRLLNGGLSSNPVLQILSGIGWFPLSIGQTPDDVLQILEARLALLPPDELFPKVESVRTKWMRSIDRVCQDMTDWSTAGAAQGVAENCKKYPSTWPDLKADGVFS